MEPSIFDSVIADVIRDYFIAGAVVGVLPLYFGETPLIAAMRAFVDCKNRGVFK